MRKFDTLSRPLPKRQIRRMIWVYAAVILVLLALPIRGSYLEYQTAHEEVEAQQRLRDRYTRQVREARVAESQKATLLGEIEAAVDILEERSGAVRRPEEWPILLEELRDAVNRSRVSLLSLSPEEAREAGGHQVRSVRLRVEGGFQSHLRLLNTLRNYPTLFLSDQITFQVTGEARRSPTLQMEVTYRTLLAEAPIRLDEVEALIERTRESIADTTGDAGTPEGGMGGGA
ncbi:MAG: hypothetical protein R6W82_08965 [bacterium]